MKIVYGKSLTAEENAAARDISETCGISYDTARLLLYRNIDTPEKNYQESRPLNCVGDNFKKIIVVREDINLWHNEDGILIIGIREFLLKKNSLEL